MKFTDNIRAFIDHLNCSKCLHSTSTVCLNLSRKLVHTILQRWRNYHMYGCQSLFQHQVYPRIRYMTQGHNARSLL